MKKVIPTRVVKYHGQLNSDRPLEMAQSLQTPRLESLGLHFEDLRVTYLRHLPPILLWLLEFCVQAWFPYTTRDLVQLENAPVAAMRRIPGPKRLPDTERLRALNPFSSQKRRLPCYRVKTFKLINFFVQLDILSFFSFRRNTSLRGHTCMLEKPLISITISQHSFPVREVNPWNRMLPKCNKK